MKHVFVMIDAEPGQNARMTIALDLARALGAMLDCLDVTARDGSEGHHHDDGDTATLTAPADQRAAAEARFRVDHSNVPFRWATAGRDRHTAIAGAAAKADLIVLGSPVGAGHDADKLIGTALKQWDKPVVVVPPDATGFRVKGEAIVLWDGSAEASAAMRAALPLLRAATTVTLVEVDDGTLKTRASEAVSFLAQRDIDARVVTDLPFGKNASDVLVEEVQLLRADYVVMGGFGRPRFIEGIFGGVTRRLLGEAHVPLFLRH
jgi:nucleotide-binding universal stress UspA family protein